jgi:mRNA interferase MazF
MNATIETVMAIPEALYKQAEMVARELGISQSELYALAIEQFVTQHASEVQVDAARQVVNQGELYWIALEDVVGIPHPHVIVQENILNHSRIHTVVACALTTNINRASRPGNVVLEAGEANLSKPSVVEVSKVSSVEKAQLGAHIGTLSERRIQQILAGMRFLQQTFH